MLNLSVGKGGANLDLISMYANDLQLLISFFPSAFVLNWLFQRQGSDQLLLSSPLREASFEGVELHSEQWKTTTRNYREASGQYPAQEEKEQVLIRGR